MKSLTIIAFLCCLAQSAPAQKTRHIQIRFTAGFGNQLLQLGEATQNSIGETLTVERFRFYISHLAVTDVLDRKTVLPANYHLIDLADSASCIISINIPDQPVKSIQFLLGVDSIRNVSGIQSGDLDPAKGMFWTWNSGYIMAKLEGTSPLAQTAGHRFTHHIGGFKSGMSTIREISLNLTDKATSQLNIFADLNHWFSAAHILPVAQYAVCHSPGTLAVQFADNYQNLFSIH